MASLPVVSGSDTVKVLQRFGWTVGASNQQSHHHDERGRNRVTLNSKPQRSCKGNIAKPDSLGESNGGRVRSRAEVIGIMTQHEYARLSGLLNAVARRQERLADKMLKAEKRFAFTEKAITDLLKTIKNRRRNS